MCMHASAFSINVFTTAQCATLDFESVSIASYASGVWVYWVVVAENILCGTITAKCSNAFLQQGSKFMARLQHFA
ncbi:hypothetical protein BT96DRAFT_912526 [Gymnopus androsaceus JB14]|uniref:Uncharacterized protein n=1 Tax=Gymnopus androsaceus JB14 TaxID=1447944 RepID=A0A6A4IMQ0_9AGAR|nr:hypothetical protein BT96DRAFT_912526 [Gymnopus androsaceus JB14]